MHVYTQTLCIASLSSVKIHVVRIHTGNVLPYTMRTKVMLSKFTLAFLFTCIILPTVSIRMTVFTYMHMWLEV